MPVFVSDDALRINDFETREHDIVDYFNGLHDLDAEEKLITLLKLGILAQSSVGTTMDVKYVEKVFESLKDKFDQQMNSIFNPNGTMDDRLAEYFGQDGKIIKDIFNPDTEGTPLNRLKVTLHDNLTEIRDKIVEQKGQEKVARKSTQKGTKFEDFCQDKLEETARVFSDIVEPTANIQTAGSGSKMGDFVVTLSNSKKRIVFEMKDIDYMSATNIKNQLDGAISNRNADYGVLVSRNVVNNTIGGFNEYDNDKLVCALADNDEEPNAWVLVTAYKWARQRVVSASDSQIGIDPEMIKQYVKDISDSMKAISRIKTKCKNIRDSADAIEDTVKEKHRIIKDRIEDILSSMNSTIAASESSCKQISL